MTASEFHTGLDMYCAWRFARRPTLPTPDEIHRFDRYAYAEDLRTDEDFPAAGQSLREMYVWNMLMAGAPPRMWISGGFADQRLGAEVTARQYAPRKLVSLVCDELEARAGADERGDGALGLAAAFDGRVPHVVALAGVGSDGWVRYIDPLPRSPFAATSGSIAGALPDPASPDIWRMSREAFARVLVAAIWMPPGARDHLRRGRTEVDVQLDMAISWVSNEPGSRLAVTHSASWLAAALEARGHRDEALRWWRQAAVVGGREGTAEMAARLEESSAEGRYWRRVAGLARRGLSPWTMPDGRFPGPDEYRFNKQADDVRAEAEFPIAMKLAQNGELTEARRRFVEIREMGSDLERAAASYYIGKTWRDQGEPAAAVPSLVEAASSANLRFIGPACLELGYAELEQGEVTMAREVFERGTFSGDTQIAPHCAAGVAEMLMEEHARVAKPYWEIAAAGSDVEVRDRAREQLERFGRGA